jgi:hypothetical protein
MVTRPTQFHASGPFHASHGTRGAGRTLRTQTRRGTRGPCGRRGARAGTASRRAWDAGLGRTPLFWVYMGWPGWVGWPACDGGHVRVPSEGVLQECAARVAAGVVTVKLPATVEDHASSIQAARSAACRLGYTLRLRWTRIESRI